jgi:hypothetical protein
MLPISTSIEASSKKVTNGMLPTISSAESGRKFISVLIEPVQSSIPDEGVNIPVETQLYPAYPNPFNPSTTIKYLLKANQTNSSLRVFDAMGRLVRTLFEGKQSQGTYSFSFNAAGLSSGIYFVQLQTETQLYTQKLVLIK